MILLSSRRARAVRDALLASLALAAVAPGCGDGAVQTETRGDGAGSDDDARDDGRNEDDDERDTTRPGSRTERDAGRGGATTPSGERDAARPGSGWPGLGATPSGGATDARPATPAEDTSDATPPDRGESCLEGASNDYKAKGPYQVKQKDVTIGNLGPFTIFYPANMTKGCKHPIVAWGNGTGVPGSAIYAHWQQHAASWGLVVIASHNAIVGANKFLEGGLDYLLEQSASGDGDFAGKLSTRAGVAGHSQGGIAATTAARHKNVEAEVCVQGGGFPPPNVAFLCLTGTGDFLRAMCTSAYNAAKGPSFLADLQGADHVGTPTLLGAITPQGAEFVRTYTAWFRCHLADDASACKLFAGSEAPLCKQGAQFATCKGKNAP